MPKMAVVHFAEGGGLDRFSFVLLTSSADPPSAA